MLISFVRTFVLYILIVVALRIMGKRQVGQLEPAELVITMMISDLAAIPIGHVSIPLMHGIIPVITLILLEAIISFVNLKFRWFRKLVSGVPVILIQNGKIREKELERLRLNMDDLMEALRTNGYQDTTGIAYAIFETNGGLSVIPTTQNRPLTLQDIGQKKRYKGLPFLLICDGKINYTALQIYNKNEEWLLEKLSAAECKVQNVFLAGVDENGKFYVQKRKKK